MFLVFNRIVDTLGSKSLILGTLDYQKEREKGDVSQALVHIDAPDQVGVVVIHFLHGAGLCHIWIGEFLVLQLSHSCLHNVAFSKTGVNHRQNRSVKLSCRRGRGIDKRTQVEFRFAPSLFSAN